MSSICFIMFTYMFHVCPIFAAYVFKHIFHIFQLVSCVFLPILYVSLFLFSHNFDWFCPKNVDGCEILHQVETIASYETLWNTMKHYETLWNTMKHYETLWNTMKHYETLWNTMKHYETLWNTVNIVFFFLSGVYHQPVFRISASRPGASKLDTVAEDMLETMVSWWNGDFWAHSWAKP